MTFRMICNIVILLMNTTLYSKCDQVPVLWQQLGLVSELESDLQGIVAGTGSGLLNSMLENNLFHLTGLITLLLLM